MKGKFERVSPTNFSQKVGFPQGWFVVAYRWMPEKSSRRKSHGKWFKVKSEYGCVYRILRFSVTLEGGPAQSKGQIVLDWPAWLVLWGFADDVDGELDLEISKVGWWQYPQMALSHPDPTQRLAGELGLLSVTLGILSIVLAILAFQS